MTVYDLFEKYSSTYKINHVRYEKDSIAYLVECELEKYNLLWNLISIHENYRRPNKLFESKMRWEGERTFDLCDLTDKDYRILSNIDLDKLPVVIRARIHDILWLMQKDYYSAEIAVNEYKFLFEKTYSNTEWTTCADMIVRALCISSQIKKNKALYTGVCEVIKSSLVKENGKDPLFLSIVLLKKLIHQKYGVYSDYLELAENIINNAIDNQQYQNKVEEAFNVKKQLLTWGKQSTHDCDMALVAYYEAEVDKDLASARDLFIAINNLKSAIHIARNCKEHEKAISLLQKLEVLQNEVPSKMAKLSHSVDMTETHDEIVKLFEGTTFAEDLLTIIRLVHIYTVEELRKQVDEECGFLGSLFKSRFLDEHGHTLLELPPIIGNESSDRIIHLHLYKKLAELTGIAGQTILWWALQEINRKHVFDETDLSFIFDTCAIARASRSKIIAFGMNLALHGEFYAALHILAPQAEDVFRHIAEKNGGLVYTLEDDDTSNAKTLSSIFEIPELADCYDPDYLFTFRGLLNEKAGSNLRNLIAHGILEPNAAFRGSSVYLCMALLKICALTSRGFLQEIKALDKNTD